MEELNLYLEEKKVKELFKELMEHICLEKPDNVHSFVVNYIQEKYALKLESTLVKYEDDDEDDMEEEEDEVPPMQEQEKPKPVERRRRSAVSAESMNPDNLKNRSKQVIQKSDEDKKTIGDRLQNNFLFASLDEESLNDLVNAITEKSFAANDTVMEQGADGDFFYIVEEGEAHIFVNDGTEEKKVKECGPGDSFGELALMYNAPRAATVKAVSSMRCWAVDRETFKLTLMESTINKRKRYEEFLDKVPILETLYKYEKLTIADALKPKQFTTGDVVMREGEAGDNFYIIEKGSVDYTQKNDEGQDVNVGKGVSGDYFGEMALLTNKPRAATVTCTSDCTFLTLDRKTFVRVMGPLDTMLQRNMGKYKSWIEKRNEQ